MPETMPTRLELSGYIHPGPGTWLLYFNYTTNPIPMNGSRGASWRPKAKAARGVRQRAFHFAHNLAKIPALGRCEVQLTQWVKLNRRRDLDNFGLFEKPLYDALVDAGVVTDDTPDLMVKLRPTIVNVRDSEGLVTEPCFTLRIERLDDEVEP